MGPGIIKIAVLCILIGAASIPVSFTVNSSPVIVWLGNALGSEDLEPYEFRIEVYVESGATASRDQLLSKRQANAIKDYLVKQYQLSPRRLATDGRGSAQPIKRTNPASPVNRRVVVVNTSTIQ